MLDLPPLLILRHGETEWNVQKRMQGALDSPLTLRGREQAKAQNRLLAQHGIEDFDCFTSPQGRARKTAKIALEGLADEVREDARLIEIGMGDWTGKDRAALQEAHPALFEADNLSFYDQAPGGEGIIALARRTRGFLANLTGPAVIVTHGITSRMLRCHALGLEPDAYDTLPGGQGVVYRVDRGQMTCLEQKS
ncbi:histidine phosphatase family protein [Thalassococcus sp. S3]|uniref:histidine phosphatase family protein n=1 Tax=Thalassococcus sp. S3 TaxID=2017482 RepID=UPI0010247702|nr:histidine phosphatase family protein [Thalassococcus sp. S3]QBF31442.1 phosphoglycerate mutase [Thalassococcus sp. S3]